MRGRPPKPTAIRKLEGNPGKRAFNTREPVATTLGSASPPAWLEPAAKRAWRAVVPRLCASKVLTDLDLQSLTMLFDAYGEWHAAREIVKREGPTYRVNNPDGSLASIRRRPEVSIAADAWRRVKGLQGEFGLTPASRVRLAVSGESESEDPFDAWLARA